MPTVETISLEELFTEKVEAAQIAEATRFKTLPSGSYVILANKVEAQEDKGRKWAHFTAAVLGEDGNKRGTVFFNASPTLGRTSTGNQDGKSKLWGQLCKALYPDLTPEQIAEKLVSDIIESAQMFKVRAYVTEAFKVPDTSSMTGFSYKTPRSEDEKKQYLEQGCQPTNFVQNLSKV